MLFIEYHDFFPMDNGELFALKITENKQKCVDNFITLTNEYTSVFNIV